MLEAEDIGWFPSHKSIRVDKTLKARKKEEKTAEEEGAIDKL